MYSVKKIMRILTASEDLDNMKKITHGTIFATSAIAIVCAIIYVPLYVGKLVASNPIWNTYDTPDYGVGLLTLLLICGVCVCELLHGAVYVFCVMSRRMTQEESDTQKNNIFVLDVESQMSYCENKKKNTFFRTVQYVRTDEFWRIIMSYIVNTCFIMTAIYFWKPIMAIIIYAGGSIIIDICITFTHIIRENIYIILTKSN